MQIETVLVRFKNGVHPYPFSPNGLEPSVSQHVIVETERGDELGVVVKTKNMMDPAELTAPLKNVVALATNEEIERSKKFDDEAKKLMPTVKKIVKESGLDMKVVSVEASYDNSRYIICFSADSRVDFRDLVRKLAETLKKRVELKQIGSRDEARMLGGIGLCGKVCCCTQNFGDFEPVSMKMAKTQNLSLNPSAISGICGKLICCLAYENPTYAKAQRMMPAVGSEVSTKDGKGTVVYNHLLNLEVDVKFAKGDDSETRTYPLDQVKFKKGGQG